MGKKLFVGLPVVFLALFGCGGEASTGLSDCNQAGYDIYLGYYTEDPTSNPEDPTSGYLVACMPDSNGTFETQFLFSYYGCQGGVDIGTVNGNRIGNSVGGSWSGNVDGVNIGGNFSGSWDGIKFSGTWNNSSGKVHIQRGSCSYYVAPNGDWVLYSLNSDFGGLNITISVSGSSVNVSWNNSISGIQGFLISFYDKQCLYDKISLSECTVWSLWCPSSVSSLTYGVSPSGCGEFYPSQPLTSWEDYVVAISAYGTPSSNVQAFATEIFTAP